MENTPNASLSTKVTNFKLIARDALRMKLIVPRQSKIACLEGQVKDLNEQKALLEHEILVATYELSKMDVNHPDYAANKKSAEENLAELKESNFDDSFKSLAEQLKEQADGIAKIESGETKVSLDDLNCLVADLIKQDALNQVV